MRLSKKRLMFLGVLLCACCAVCLPSALSAAVRLSLGRACPESRVSVGKCSFKPSGEIVIEDISINGSGLYEIDVREVRISLGLPALVRARIPRITLHEPTVVVTLGTRTIRSLAARRAAGAKGWITVERLSVSGAHLEISSADLLAEAHLSAEYLPVQQKLEQLEFSAGHLRYPGWSVRAAALSLQQGRSDGRLSVRGIRYNRIQAQEVEASLLLDEAGLRIVDLRARLFGGALHAQASVETQHPFNYKGRCALEGVDFSRLVDELDLQKKIAASGTLNGSLDFEGSSIEAPRVRGRLSAAGARQTFAVTDEALLRRIAAARGEDFQVIVEAFKDYEYTTGMLSVSSREDTLGLKVYLDGEQGKRDLSINLHRFF